MFFFFVSVVLSVVGLILLYFVGEFVDGAELIVHVLCELVDVFLFVFEGVLEFVDGCLVF